MSSERLEQVRAFLPPDGTDLAVAFGPARSMTSFGLVAGDARVRLVSRGGELGGTGRDAMYESWADWLEPWESYRVYHDDLIERGDDVIWLVRLRGVTKRGGVEIEEEAATVFRFEGEAVQEIVFTLDREAVGR